MCYCKDSYLVIRRNLKKFFSFVVRFYVDVSDILLISCILLDCLNRNEVVIRKNTVRPISREIPRKDTHKKNRLRTSTGKHCRTFWSEKKRKGLKTNGHNNFEYKSFEEFLSFCFRSQFWKKGGSFRTRLSKRELGGFFFSDTLFTFKK